MQDVQRASQAAWRPPPDRVAQDRRGLWVASMLELLGLVLFVGLFNFLLPNLGQRLDGLPLILLGLAMSLVPAALWMLFFHRLDRLEPEPKGKIVHVFLLSALATGALVQPLLQHLFQVNEWLYASWATELFGGILVVGALQALTIYLVVRYGIYMDPEFDERVDGVIYATAAGLGLATVLNFEYVVAHGGVDLDVGSIRMVINALAYASFAGVLGYFLGQTRFEHTPPAYLPGGFALSAVLIGLFFFLEDRITSAGFQVNSWSGLVFALVVAGITLSLVFWLVQRANEETLRLLRDASAAVPGPGEAVAPQESPAQNPPEVDP